MALSIRDPRAAKLAKQLADRRNTTMTAAIIYALEAELAREQRPLRDRLADIARELKAHAGPNPRTISQKEIDDMWTR